MKMLDRYNRRLRYQKLLNAALLTVTAYGTIDVLVTDRTWAKVLAAVTSMLALFTSVSQLSTNIDKLAEQHRSAGHSLWLIREEYIHLIADLKAGAIDEVEGRRLRDILTQRTARVYESVPDTDGKAYKEAQKALKNNEELTFTTREIDLLLPAALREIPEASDTPRKPSA